MIKYQRIKIKENKNEKIYKKSNKRINKDSKKWRSNKCANRHSIRNMWKHKIKKAQEKLKSIKERPASKPFPIMCADIDQIKSITMIDNKSEKIIRELMPGPITIVLRKNSQLPEYINSGKETIAIRMATSNELKELIKILGCPVFMTSANKSGEEVCKTLDDIERKCPYLDGMLEGNVSFGQASTIVDCTSNEIKILRKGPISEDEIIKALNKT